MRKVSFCVLFFILSTFSCVSLGSALPTLAPTAVVPTSTTTPEPVYQIEYQVNLNENALCNDNELNLESLQLVGMKIRYTDFSHGERELVYQNLHSTDFPWTYTFTTNEDDLSFSDRLYVEVDAPITTKYSCHELTCSILVNGVEVDSETSVVRNLQGENIPLRYTECGYWISDLD
jgi:hypothetical protein